MADSYRRHCVISAPVEDVWSIVSNPHTHPDWWPEVHAVHGAQQGEPGEYVRRTKRLGFLDLVDTVWVVEPMEHLRQVNFRCTATGTYTRFSLTPAQESTFVEIEGGVDPISVRGRLAKAASPMFFKRWLGELLDALPKVVARMKQPAG
jgi:uncharacterized protein YndB with AHSA1/START domain